MAVTRGCLSTVTVVVVLLGRTGLGLQPRRAEPAAANFSSFEEVTASVAANQRAILDMMQECSHVSRVARRQEMGKVMEDLRAMVQNATQETLKGMASLRKEMTTKVTLLEQTLANTVTTLLEMSGQGCPDGWLRHASSCYLVADDSYRTWEDSLMYCRGLGGDLAKITSAEEQEFLKAHMSGSSWIGLNDKAFEGHFMWTDVTPPTYTRWYEGQPNDYGGGQDCVFMNSGYDYTWNDHSCSTILSVVCERPVDA